MIDPELLKDCGVFFINEYTSILYTVIENQGEPNFPEVPVSSRKGSESLDITSTDAKLPKYSPNTNLKFQQM